LVHQVIWLSSSKTSLETMGSPSGDAKETPVTSGASHIELSTRPWDLDIEGAEITEVVTNHGVEKYSQDDDEAMRAMANFDGEPLILDEETSRRLLRRIDWHLMPVM
jgi:hypothetical protein